MIDETKISAVVDEDFSVKLGRFLRRARYLADYSQAGVASAVSSIGFEVSRQMIMRLELGYSQPNMRLVLLLFIVLGVSFDEFLDTLED